MDSIQIRAEKANVVKQLNEHFEGCQVCQQTSVLCELAERILNEAEVARLRQERQQNNLQLIRKGY